MIVLDASVALKWFAPDEILAAEASRVLDEVERAPEEFLVPDIFMAECLAVLCRMRGATVENVQQAVELLESLGMSTSATAGPGAPIASTITAAHRKTKCEDRRCVAINRKTPSLRSGSHQPRARRLMADAIAGNIMTQHSQEPVHGMISLLPSDAPAGY